MKPPLPTSLPRNPNNKSKKSNKSSSLSCCSFTFCCKKQSLNFSLKLLQETHNPGEHLEITPHLGSDTGVDVQVILDIPSKEALKRLLEVAKMVSEEVKNEESCCRTKDNP